MTGQPCACSCHWWEPTDHGSPCCDRAGHIIPTRTMRARWPGTCARCSAPITIGTLIGKVGRGWWEVSCVLEQQRAAQPCHAPHGDNTQ